MRLTIRAVCVQVGFTILASLTGRAQKDVQPLPDLLIGKWKIVDIYKTTDLWGITGDQSKTLLNKYLVFSTISLTSCGQDVPIFQVGKKKIDVATFLEGRKVVPFRDVGITSSSIQEIVINHNAGGNCFDTYSVPGEDIYIKSQNEILIDFEGVYLKAVRASE